MKNEIGAQFLEAVWGKGPSLFPSYGELRAFRSSEPERPLQEFFTSPNTAADWAWEQCWVGGRDVYYGVLPRASKSGTAKDCVKGVNILWADFDGKTFTTGKRGAWGEIARMPVPPQIIVDSGHGYHTYWLLDGEWSFDYAQKIMKGIEIKHGSDNVSDAPRILRVPGTLNFKTSPHPPVRVVKFDLFTGGYDPNAFQMYIDLWEANEWGKMNYDRIVTYSTEGWEPSGEDAPKISEGGRNNGLAKVAMAMIHKGLSPEDLLAALNWENQQRCKPPLSASEVAAIAASVERYRE